MVSSHCKPHKESSWEGSLQVRINMVHGQARLCLWLCLETSTPTAQINLGLKLRPGLHGLLGHEQRCGWRPQVMVVRAMKAYGWSQGPDSGPVGSHLPVPSTGQVLIP